MKVMKALTLMLLLCVANPLLAQKQTLSGTRWDVTVAGISSKPYNFIFSDTGNKGNALYPDGTLANFTWAEDDKGNWTITVERMVNGVQKTETFYGKVTGGTGTGFYASTATKKNLKPLTMVKK